MARLLLILAPQHTERRLMLDSIAQVRRNAPFIVNVVFFDPGPRSRFEKDRDPERVKDMKRGHYTHVAVTGSLLSTPLKELLDAVPAEALIRNYATRGSALDEYLHSSMGVPNFS